MLRILLASAILAVASADGLAAGRDCGKPSDVPPGVRLAERPGCAKPARERPKPAREGYYDLGNGTEIHIRGRVSVEGRIVR